jgi:NADPH:quinone reductase-like Zn-dependent oxidoreductase
VVPPFQVFARDLTIRGFAFPAVVRNDEPLEAVKRFVSEGISSHALVPAIAHTFTLDEIVEAHRFLESGNQVGKAVVSV